MAFLDDIKAKLATDGVGDGTTEWPIFLEYAPPEPDQMLILFETPGQPPHPRVTFDRPGLQVMARAADHGSDVARAKLQEVQDALHGFAGTIGSVYYIQILASGGVFPVGVDENLRFRATQNYSTMRSRP